MMTKMRQTIEVLKVKVAKNLEEIKQNELRFKQIMGEGKALEYAEELSGLLEKNKSLLNENFDFINVQLALLKFFGKAEGEKDTGDEEWRKVHAEAQNAIDTFQYTINGKLSYQKGHPKFYDDHFCMRLLAFYANTRMDSKYIDVLENWAQGHVN